MHYSLRNSRKCQKIPHLTKSKKVLLSGSLPKVNRVHSNPRPILYLSILYNTPDQPTKDKTKKQKTLPPWQMSNCDKLSSIAKLNLFSWFLNGFGKKSMVSISLEVTLSFHCLNHFSKSAPLVNFRLSHGSKTALASKCIDETNRYSSTQQAAFTALCLHLRSCKRCNPNFPTGR